MTPDRRRLRCSYGGEAGVWVKKRRNSSDHKKKQHPASQSSTTILSPSPSQDVVSSHHEDSKRSSENDTPTGVKSLEKIDRSNFSSCDISSSARLIGWDDVLCRPIYKKCTRPLSPQRQETIDNELYESQEIEDETNADLSEKVDDDDDGVDPSEQRSWIRSNKKSYGSKRQIIGGPFMSSSSCSTNSNGNDGTKKNQQQQQQQVESQPMMVDGLEEKNDSRNNSSSNSNIIVTPELETKSHIFDRSSPSTSENSSTAQKSSVCRHDEEENDIPTDHDRIQPSKQDKKSSISQVVNKRKKNKNNSKNVVPESKNSEREEQKSTLHQQPSSHTSLSQAKAFFEHLDSTQKLVITTTTTTSDNVSETIGGGDRDQRQATIRTTRIKNTSCPKFQKDYATYCNVCRDGGYLPLSIKEYANNQGVHFVQSGIEGVLDEAR